MTKTLSIEFTGGFHNGDTVIRAKIQDKGTYLGAYISESQVKKLDSVFCGVTGCLCGGANRAKMKLPKGWADAGNNGGQSGLIAYQNKA
jgi:hypothetical protein